MDLYAPDPKFNSLKIKSYYSQKGKKARHILPAAFQFNRSKGARCGARKRSVLLTLPAKSVCNTVLN